MIYMSKCYNCGKRHITYDNYTFKRYDRTAHRVKSFCSYSCYNEDYNKTITYMQLFDYIYNYSEKEQNAFRVLHNLSDSDIRIMFEKSYKTSY